MEEGTNTRFVVTNQHDNPEEIYDDYTDRAHRIGESVDLRYPKRIVLVMDNLNTHTPASLYEAFEPEDARINLKRPYPALQE